MKRCIVVLFALVMTFIVSIGSVLHATTDVYTSVPESRYHERYTCEKAEFKTDFHNNEMYGFELSAKKDVTFENGKMYFKEDRTFILGSFTFIGDYYALKGGDVRINLNVAEGTLYIGFRLTKKLGTIGRKGIWLKYENKKLKVVDNEDNVYAEAELDLTSDTEMIIEDALTHIDVFTAEGEDKKEVLSFDVSQMPEADLAGYMSISGENTKGYISSVAYTHYDIEEISVESEQRLVDYSNWVATDDLGRVTAVGALTKGDALTGTASQQEMSEKKYVGIFYFLCLVGGGFPIVDHTQIYLESGIEGLKSFLENGSVSTYGEFWAEPYFGYYTNTDEWVYRKHAYMLNAAGVDFVFLDVSNAETYVNAHMTLFETWRKIRQEGGQTPQICFFTGDNQSTLRADIDVLMTTVYSKDNYEKYEDLFFMWEGKPLLLGNPFMKKTKREEEILSKFTLRGCWAWVDNDCYWSWLDEVPQHKGRDIDGNFEQMTVTMGHHATTSKGRSYVEGKEPISGKDDFEFSSATSGKGLCFAEQFEYAISQDPSVIMITGWNEWTAGYFQDGETKYLANTNVNGYLFVDNFNPEFSRDAEPMKLRDGVGFGDNYYYQMVSYIKKFKGVDKTSNKKVTEKVSIDIHGDVSQWDSIDPLFTDSVGDTLFRCELSYNNKSWYINNSGLTDLDMAKVAQDDKNIYFLITAQGDILTDIQTDTNRMNLYLDIDQDHKTGWEGYDFVINRSRTEDKCSVESFKNNTWSFKSVGEANYAVSENYMMVSVPKSVLKTDADILSFDFKWADNSTLTGDVMQFMDLGDCAPNDRFNFRFTGTESYNEGNLTVAIIIAVIAIISLVALGILIYKKKGKHHMAAA